VLLQALFLPVEGPDSWVIPLSLQVSIAPSLVVTAKFLLPSGKHTKNDGKSPFLMGKSTIHGHVQ
jgi:hypothetical protein